MIQIEPFKKYTKKEIMAFLEFNDAQLKLAEQHKLVVFFDGCMYGVYLFQFLIDNYKRLEDLRNS
jgi:hypothetical protein